MEDPNEDVLDGGDKAVEQLDVLLMRLKNRVLRLTDTGPSIL